MAPQKLKNYLRTHRKRYSLTQEDVAYLLGCTSDHIVSHHEIGSRLPSLRTALAYEVIFDTPVAELFAGVFEQIEREACDRASVLAHEFWEARRNDPTGKRRREVLKALMVAMDIVDENL